MSKREEIEIAIEDDTGRADFMADFLSQKERIEGHIAFLAQSTKDLESLQERSALAVSSVEETEVSKRLARVIEQVNRRSKEAQNMLKAMKAETQRLQKRARKAGGHPPAHLRIREQTHNSLVRTMVETMRQHQIVKRRSAESAREKCVRRSKFVWPELTEDELEAKMSDNPTGMFASGIKQTANAEMHRAFNEAHDRARDVAELERSVQEMYQMFVDLATLVHDQGETLNSIEHNIDTAHSFVEKGNKELIKAHIYQKKKRKCCCCIIILGVVILVAFTVPTSIMLLA